MCTVCQQALVLRHLQSLGAGCQEAAERSRTGAVPAPRAMASPESPLARCKQAFSEGWATCTRSTRPFLVGKKAGQKKLTACGWAHARVLGGLTGPLGPAPPNTPNTEPPGVYAAGGKGARARTWLLAPDDNRPLWTCFPSVSQELG